MLFAVVLQTCIYCVGMSVVYALKFSRTEALALASFHRYLNVPCLALGMMLTLLAFRYLQISPSSWYPKGMILLCAVMILSSPTTVYEYMTRTSISPSIEARIAYTQAAEKVRRAAGDEAARVYVVAQGGEGYERLILRYELRPLAIGGSGSFAADGWLDGLQKEATQKSPDQWREELEDFDYVLCYMLDASFREDYAALFADPDTIAERSVYRVDHETRLLVLCE